MSLESMKNRLNYRGGAAQQDRMIQDKFKSMLSATKYSYQAAKFSKYPDSDETIIGLFNPSIQTEDYDTKVISVPFDADIRVGTIFLWKNTNTYWIPYTQDRTELAYFKGSCRRCDHSIQWVDKDRQVQTTLASVIGPTIPTLRTREIYDLPNANIEFMTSDTQLNRDYFNLYQRFVLGGLSYKIEQRDYLSMPGLLQVNATQDYTNLIENDVEEDLANKWNMQPIIPEYGTEYAIDGVSGVKPYASAEFSTYLNGGYWVIIENQGKTKNLLPAVFETPTNQKTVSVVWDSKWSGAYTLGYIMPNGKVYQKYVNVESLM